MPSCLAYSPPRTKWPRSPAKPEPPASSTMAAVAVPFLRDAVVGLPLDAREVLVEQHVHRAGDRIGAVLRRSAARHDLDALHQTAGHQVEVRRCLRGSPVRTGGRPPARDCGSRPDRARFTICAPTLKLPQPLVVGVVVARNEGNWFNARTDVGDAETPAMSRRRAPLPASAWRSPVSAVATR